MVSTRSIERLSPADVMMIWPEAMGWSSDIGALAILDGAPLLDADGHLDLPRLRRHVANRLHLLPRFRQVIHRPRFGLGGPCWVEAPPIDIERHVDAVALPPPGDERQMLEVCETLRERGLPLSRPVWAMTFITGLPGGRVALLMRVHHAMADGMAGIASLAAFTDAAPEGAFEPAGSGALPSRRALFADNVRRKLRGMSAAVRALSRPGALARRIRSGWPALRGIFLQGRAPVTSLNRPIGRRRRLAIVRADLATIKRIAHQHDAKVNDVFMAVLAAGFGGLLRSRGEAADVILRAAVPVSLHGRGAAASGNQTGMMIVPLPVGRLDDDRRLRAIAAATAVRRKQVHPHSGTLLRNTAIQKAFLHYCATQRLINVYAANVSGPGEAVWIAGARVLEVFPVVPIQGNITVGAGALSYAGQFNVTIVADRELAPDIDVLVAHATRSLASLERRTAGTSAEAVRPQGDGLRQSAR